MKYFHVIRGGRFCDLSKLSTYRSELMGFAILIIVLYHFCNMGGTSELDKIVRLVFSKGYVGVDIFMVVSGLGLTYSMLKDDNLKRYYLKRWVRIFPFFTFITLIECWIIRGETFELALLRSTTLGYWFGFPYIDWYIPGLVGLYFIYPIIFYLLIKPRRYWAALFVSACFLISSVIIGTNEILDWKHLALVYRVPDFIMGSMAAIAIKDGNQVNKWTIPIILTSFFVGALMALFRIGSPYCTWYVNLCLMPLYLYLLCNLFTLLSSFKIGLKVLLPFGFVGLFTFELYRISSSFERLLSYENCPSYHFLFVLLYFTLSIVLSYTTYLVFKKINTYFFINLSRILNL